MREPLVADPDFTLFLGDSLDVLPDLPTGCFDAIVTSPPYADQRPGQGAPADRFADWMAPFLAELIGVINPNGSMLLNLGRVFRDGEEIPYGEATVAVARELGWKRIDTLIWHKPNAHPFGAPQYLHNKHETVYWLAPHTGAYRGYTSETRTPASEETVARRGRAGLRGPKNRSRGGYVPKQRTALNPDGVKPSSVFSCYIGREKGSDHDSPMSLELAEHLVGLACPPGGHILDPFGGSGTTALAARRTSRSATLIEQDPQAARMAARRLSQQSLFARVEEPPVFTPAIDSLRPS